MAFCIRDEHVRVARPGPPGIGQREFDQRRGVLVPVEAIDRLVERLFPVGRQYVEAKALFPQP